jgi:hypothetical protein
MRRAYVADRVSVGLRPASTRGDALRQGEHMQDDTSAAIDGFGAAASLPSFSIITPALNAARTIEQTLDSVAQQVGVVVQHVVVDGGSTDGTVELLRKRQSLDWSSEPDDGLSDAFNRGVRRSSGDVIGWLNADDTYRPGALLAVARALARSGDSSWATGRCHIIDGAGREIRPGVTRYKNALLRTGSHRLLLMNNYISAPATFVRRSELDAVGLLDTSLKYSMDYDLWLRLWKRSEPVILREVLAEFRMTEGTLSMTGFRRQFEEHEMLGIRHAGADRVAATGNRLLSRGIVTVYAGMQRRRR